MPGVVHGCDGPALPEGGVADHLRMSRLLRNIRRRGGVAATHELLRDGHTSHELTRAVRAGTIIRARQGHYCAPEVGALEQQALRVGGRLAGLAAARSLGLWTPSAPRLEVEVPRHARALRSRTDATARLIPNHRRSVIVDWTDQRHNGTRTTLGIRACLTGIIRRQSPMVAFAIVESALHGRRLSRAEWRSLLLSVPATRRGRLDAATGASESGGESILKFGLLTEHLRFRQQVRVPRAGRVDFLVGDRLVIEADGAEFHTDAASFEEDRRRDAVLGARGFRVLRFSYKQITERWPEVRAAILAAIARGDHLT